MEARTDILRPRRDEDIAACLPGVEVDETQFAKVNADPKRVFKRPVPKYPNGLVRDY